MTVIAGRLCVDHHRRRGRVSPTDDIDLGSVDDDPTEAMSRAEDCATLARALERLGPRHAQVLDLRERQALTYHEIAAELDVPHSTVETLLFRARRALRREYLAVAGARLSGLAPVAWLGVRIGRVRDKFGFAANQLLPYSGPVAAGVAAVTVAFVGPVAHHDVVAVRAPVALTAIAAPAGDPPTVTPDHAPSAGAVPARPARVAITPDGAAGVAMPTREETAARGESMPTSVVSGPVNVGLDPTHLPEWLAGLTTPETP
jgi:hypothetical protein